MQVPLIKKIPLFLLCILLGSCKNQESETEQATYISGQIINPVLDYIVFSKGNAVLDTVKLDAKDFFQYRAENIKPGLYFIKHGESQAFFLEPGDSLLLHLNTLDFDESLAYSGKGGEKNNLLMDLYLSNETENQNLTKWYTLPPKEFERKIDSLKALKTNRFEGFVRNNKVSEAFKEVAKANIMYDYYSKKEMYAAANRSKPEQLDAAFFEYRKNIDFDRSDLNYYYPYHRFMNRFFENLVCNKFDNQPPIERNSFDYNFQKIKLIDSLVKSDSIKNSLLRYNAMWYLLNAKDAEEETRFFEAYSKMVTDPKNVAEMQKVYDATVKLTAGNTIPNVALVNIDNVVVNLLDIVKGPTVVYFWSSQSASQYKNIHLRAAELKSKYPEYTFLALNTDKHFKNWRKTVKKAGYNPETEYQLENLTDAERKLVINALNKVFILNKDGIILEGKTNMFNPNFEELLLGFLNR